MNKKLRIGVDLDDTVWNFHEKFFEFYNDKFGTSHKVEDHKEYDLVNFLQIERDYLEDIFDEFRSSSFFMEMKLIHDVKDIILHLNEKHEIYFITARNEKDSEITKKQIMNLLNIERPVYFVRKNWNSVIKKSEICLSENIDYMIDDAFYNLEDCSKEGIKCFLIDMPWNRSFELDENIIRVKGWKEILEKLEEFENE